MYFLNVLLGFLVFQIQDVSKRNKHSDRTPNKFCLLFFIKDTWQKIVVSLAFSLCLALIVHANLIQGETVVTIEIGAFSFNALGLIYVTIGAVPEFILQYLKKKFGFLQPKKSNNSN